MRESLIYATLLAVLSACVSSSVLPLSASTIQISADGGQFCGKGGTRRAAVQIAALETLRRGFDKFIVTGASGRTDKTLIGRTPVVTTTTGTSTTTDLGDATKTRRTTTAQSTGGDPIYGVTYEQDMIVEMFRAGDPRAADALDARQALGPDAEAILARGRVDTCG